MNRFKLILVAVAALLITFVVWQAQRQDIPQVSLLTLNKGEVQATVANTRAGTVKSCRRSKLSIPLGGRVEKLLVKEGDQVVAGQVLLQLWNKDQAARTAQAQANIKATQLAEQRTCVNARHNQREAKRLQALLQRKLTSEEAVDNARTLAEASTLACQAAQAELASAREAHQLQQALLELTTLKAPFAGVVAEINGEIGEYVTPSPPGVATPPAVDLIDTSCLYVTAPIDEVDAMALRPGLSTEIKLDAFGNRVFNGTLSRIAPYVLDLEKQARTVEVDVKFAQLPEDVALLVGYSADIVVVLDTREQVLRVPSEAVIEGNKVLRFNAETSTLEKIEFNPGLSNWTYTEVLSGLTLGDRIVTSLDTPGIAEGIKVTVAQPDQQATGTPSP